MFCYETLQNFKMKIKIEGVTEKLKKTSRGSFFLSQIQPKKAPQNLVQQFL